VTELLGNPAGLAQHQFELAQQLCGPCRDYHAVWPYRRLARITSQLEGDVHTLAPILSEATPKKGRILIAGAADAGLLAFTVDATRADGPSVTVADRCETPLSVCRRYAKPAGLDIETRAIDLSSEILPERYHVIFMHGFMRFVPEEERSRFFRSLGRMLERDGQIIAAEMLPRPTGNETRNKDHVQNLISAIKANGVVLPEDEAAFRNRLSNEMQAWGARQSGAVTAASVPHALEEAGFVIRKRQEFEREGALAVANVRLLNTRSQVVVASPK
jgi:2-polyprenyl-3-methyl-5-hydroxy-6-metoxy-1,4-benzoquinol methylase